MVLLILDGAGVIVLSTADDFTEVNAAYGLQADQMQPMV